MIMPRVNRAENSAVADVEAIHLVNRCVGHLPRRNHHGSQDLYMYEAQTSVFQSGQLGRGRLCRWHKGLTRWRFVLVFLSPVD